MPKPTPKEEVVIPTTIQMVATFHEAFGQKDARIPTAFDPKPHQADELNDIAQQMERTAERCHSLAKENPDNKAFIRLQLIQSELAELALGFSKNDVTECADALTDLQYVIDGTYLATGLAGIKDGLFLEVQRSNMSKLGEDGKPILNEAGRVQKGPNYTPPALDDIVENFVEQMHTKWDDIIAQEEKEAEDARLAALEEEQAANAEAERQLEAEGDKAA